MSLQSLNGAFYLQNKHKSIQKQYLCFWLTKNYKMKEETQKCAAKFYFLAMFASQECWYMCKCVRVGVRVHVCVRACVSRLKQEVTFGSRRLFCATLWNKQQKCENIYIPAGIIVCNLEVINHSFFSTIILFVKVNNMLTYRKYINI